MNKIFAVVLSFALLGVVVERAAAIDVMDMVLLSTICGGGPAGLGGGKGGLGGPLGMVLLLGALGGGPGGSMGMDSTTLLLAMMMSNGGMTGGPGGYSNGAAMVPVGYAPGMGMGMGMAPGGYAPGMGMGMGMGAPGAGGYVF